MLHSHLPRGQHRLLGPRVTLTFSGITGVYVAGYETEFEPLRDIAGLRFRRLSSGGSAPTPSMPNLRTHVSTQLLQPENLHAPETQARNVADHMRQACRVVQPTCVRKLTLVNQAQALPVAAQH